MSIRTKLVAGFALVLFSLGLALITTLVLLRAVSDANAVVINHLDPAKDAALTLRLHTRRTDDDGASVVMAQTPKQLEDYMRAYDTDVKSVNDDTAHLATLADTDQQRTALADFEKSWTAYLSGNTQAFDLKRAGKTFEAQRSVIAVDVEKSIDLIATYQTEAARLADAGILHATQLQQLAFTLSIGLGVLGTVGSFIVVFATTRALAGTVQTIEGSIDAVSAASGQIASGNSDLAQRTEEQAASLEETASSMEELTSTVRQNADNAKQANQLAIGASDVAIKGGRVVSEVVTTMASISASSKKVVDIISVIDGIAFQTNILALNAAVEAARAGEQGRGFAVVAGEVRNLAQRSAGAAKEIKTLISDSVEKASDGSKLVDHAGKTMEEIVASVKRVTDIMAEIAAASAEQSAGIDQVNLAVTQMDQVTQQNAALVEEISAAAVSLSDLTKEVVSSMRVFGVQSRLTNKPAKRAASAARPALSPRALTSAPTSAKAAPRVHKLGAAPKGEAPEPAGVGAAGHGDNWESF